MEHDALLHYGIKGMKWGVRRYQNKDGSLTPKGEARYDRDKRENAAKKKENRIDLSQPDPKRWAKEDLERTPRSVTPATAPAVSQGPQRRSALTAGAPGPSASSGGRAALPSPVRRPAPSAGGPARSSTAPARPAGGRAA